MTIKGLKPDGWPRLSTLGDALTKEQYRALQAGGTADVDDALAQRLIALGVAAAEEGGAE